MAFTKTSLLTILGFVIWGDLGELTLYRDRYRRLVVYPKQYPKGIPSAEAAEMRACFQKAAALWTRQPIVIKNEWNKAAARASLKMSGYNLFMSNEMAWDPIALRTLERQTATILTAF